MKKLNLNQEKNIRVGIDIGTSKICCAIAELESAENKLKLIGIGDVKSTSLKRGLIIHRDNIIEEIEKAITAAETMAAVKVNRATLSISGDHIRGINTQSAIPIRKSESSQIPSEHEIRREDVQRVVELARGISFPVDREILHVMPQEYVIDTMEGIKDPVGMTGRRLEARVHLVTVTNSAATNLANCVEELGIHVDGIVYQGLASALSTLDKDEKELGVALVDIGAGTTDITVYHESGIRHTGVIPIGASSITNDIAVMLQIGTQDAEEIKLKYASAKASMASPDLDFDLPVKNGGISRKLSEHELSRYVEARMIEILQLVAREISRADVQGKLTYGIVLTGGGSELKNLAGLAEEVLNIRVRIGLPKGISGVVELAKSPQYSAVVGLLHWTIRPEAISMITHKNFTAREVFGKISTWFKDFF